MFQIIIVGCFSHFWAYQLLTEFLITVEIAQQQSENSHLLQVPIVADDAEQSKMGIQYIRPRWKVLNLAYNQCDTGDMQL